MTDENGTTEYVLIKVEELETWKKALDKAIYRCEAPYWRQTYRWDVSNAVKQAKTGIFIALTRKPRQLEFEVTSAEMIAIDAEIDAIERHRIEDEESRGSDLYTEEEHAALMRKMGGQ